jgi:hypothetical protein
MRESSLSKDLGMDLAESTEAEQQSGGNMSFKYWTQLLHNPKLPMCAVAVRSHPTRRRGRKKDGSRVRPLASRGAHRVQYVRHILADVHTELTEHTISDLSPPPALPILQPKQHIRWGATRYVAR